MVSEGWVVAVAAVLQNSVEVFCVNRPDVYGILRICSGMSFPFRPGLLVLPEKDEAVLQKDDGLFLKDHGLF